MVMILIIAILAVDATGQNHAGMNHYSVVREAQGNGFGVFDL